MAKILLSFAFDRVNFLNRTVAEFIGQLARLFDEEGIAFGSKVIVEVSTSIIV